MSTSQNGPKIEPNGDVYAIAFQSGFNPAILIGGAFDKINGQQTGHLARFSLTGQLDLTFKPIDSGTVRAIAFDGVGIIAGGSFTIAGAKARKNLARFTLQGAVDDTFGVYNGGVDGAIKTTRVDSIAIDSQKRVVIGGDFLSINGNFNSPGVARLLPNGTTDTGFTSGKNWPDDVVHAVAVDSQNRVIIGGEFKTQAAANGPRKFQFLARLNQNGTLDTSFGEEITNQSPKAGIQGGQGVYAVKVDAAGNVVFGGSFSTINGNSHVGIARYNAAGNLDGQAFLSSTSVAGVVHAIDFDNVGRILIAGSFSKAAGADRGSLAELETDGHLHTAFNPEAITTVSPSGSTQGIVYAILPCNSVYVGGLFNHVGKLNDRKNLLKVGYTGTYFSGF